MQTNFTFAANITQVSDDEFYTIPINNLNLVTSSESYAESKDPLYTISGLWMERFRSKTNQIWTTNYAFSDVIGTITGIEVQINIKRNARIEDLVIQLTLHGKLIGDNRAIQQTSQESFMSGIAQPTDFFVYGGPNDMWGTLLTVGDINDPSFGVVISFQSNETLPHRDLVYINQLGMRVIYS